jgi:hypothetical protein
MSINPDCRRHLAEFFRGVQNRPAQWLSIISGAEGNVSCMSTFLGMNYDDLYLPLLFSCGLIRKMTSGRHKTTQIIPSIESFRIGLDYTWNDFIMEFMLDLEVSYIFQHNINGVKKKMYYLRVGKFKEGAPRFTVWDQIRSNKEIPIKGIRGAQQRLIKSFANTVPPSFSIPFNTSTAAEEASPFTEMPSPTLATTTYMENINQNFKYILQNHLFDRILKSGVDANEVWDKIDQTKLKEGISEFLKALHASRYESQQKILSEMLQCTNSNDEPINLNGKIMTEFPSLHQYGIPMVKSCLQSVLRDIYSISQVDAASNLLTFQLFNESTCSLLNIPSSADYNRFKRNAKRTKWIEQLLRLNAVDEERSEEGVAWILRFLGENYSEQFTAVAVQLGLLLAPKVMDAESACAMWEEANCPVRAQRIILRHLKHFFGRRITVPEQKIRDLEEGTLLPTCDSVVIDNIKIHFWYRDIDETVSHRLKTEVKCRGLPFLSQFNQLDLVFGGDHGARRFRAVIRLILRNKDDGAIAPHSIVLHVGNIECKKDTRNVLEATIGVPLNESLKRIVGKFIRITPESIFFLDQRPMDIVCPEQTVLMESRTFVAGDLSFYGTVLGKENMSGSWCTWCTLSKGEWGVVDHPIGELWSIEKIRNIRQNVLENNLAEIPQNIRGCTENPLFDAVPVSNYVLSVLHIIIGIGNSLIDGLFEWVEERVEQLTVNEMEARNSVLFAEVHHRRLNDDYEHWLENDGIVLVDKQLNKSFLNETFHEKVSSACKMLCYSLLILHKLLRSIVRYRSLIDSRHQKFSCLRPC